MTADHDYTEDPAATAGDQPPASVGAVEQPELAATDPSDLVGELTRVMHAAAESQHVRIAGELQRHRLAQVKAIKARATSVSAELKATSEHDAAEIDAWAKTASELIVTERARRIDGQRELFEAELMRQEVMVERKVQAVEAAVEAHQAELDAFFSQLKHESDPVGIAQLASSLPSFPSLTEAADAAMRQAAAEFTPRGAPSAASTSAAASTPAAAPAAPNWDPAAQAAATTWDTETVAAGAVDQGAAEVAADQGAAEAGAGGDAAPEAPASFVDGSLDDGVEVTAARLMSATNPAVPSDDGPGVARPWPAPGAIAVHAGVNSVNGEAKKANGTEAPAKPESQPLLRSIPSTRPMGLLRWNRKPESDPDGEH